MFWTYVGTMLIAFCVAGFYTKYIQATAAERAERAATYDLFLMLFTSGIQQMWAIHANSFGILVVGDVTSALGTYAFIKVAKSLRNTPKKSLKNANWVVRSLSKILES